MKTTEQAEMKKKNLLGLWVLNTVVFFLGVHGPRDQLGLVEYHYYTNANATI